MGVGSELSSSTAPKAETYGLPDPPSQLSAEEEEERKRQRLVPDAIHHGGRNHFLAICLTQVTDT